MNIPDFDDRYFQPEEVLSFGTIKLWKTKGLLLLNLEAFNRLNAYREIIDLPLVVNTGRHNLRGTRTHAENATIRGAAHFSAHLLGSAFDVSCPDLPVEKLAEKAKESHLWTGIGIYPTWIHLDCCWRNTQDFVLWRGNH